jgi:hypothetical protein
LVTVISPEAWAPQFMVNRPVPWTSVNVAAIEPAPEPNAAAGTVCTAVVDLTFVIVPPVELTELEHPSSTAVAPVLCHWTAALTT